MFNDNENNPEINRTENNAPPNGGDEQKPETPADVTSSPAAPGNTDSTTQRNPYYEPWQQPAYKEAGTDQPAYSPGPAASANNAYQRYQPPTEPPREKKRGGAGRAFVKAVVLILICALAGGGAAYGVVQYRINNGDFGTVNEVVLGSEQSATSPSATPAETTASSEPSNLPTAGQTLLAEDVYTLATAQVVGVNSEGVSTNVFGQRSQGAVSGSGFIISSDGYIITNYHVISYAVEQNFSLTVMLHDGQSYPAVVIGYEEENDVAVIKINADGLNAVAIGDNNNMQVGDTIYAVGNPLGELDYTMTSGIVSALDRVIQVDAATSINMFQIDAAVNSGNSGGPVYNEQGQVIGIVSAKYASTGVEGIGFAIPINDAYNLVEQIIENGYVTGKPSMGIEVSNWNQSYAQYYETKEGALVESVTSGSAAEKAGMQVGDIIVKIGDSDVSSLTDLKEAIKDFRAGDTTQIVVERDKQDVTLTITFDEMGVVSTVNEVTTSTQSSSDATTGATPPADQSSTNSAPPSTQSSSDATTGATPPADQSGTNTANGTVQPDDYNDDDEYDD